MPLIAIDQTQSTGNNAPIWTSTPAPEFTEGVADSYAAPVTDPDGDSLTFSLTAGTLPSGVTLNTSTGALVADGTQVEGTTAGLRITADDGTTTSDSDLFSLVIVGSGGELPAATIVVADSGGDYTVIQTAINNASAGDVIEIRADEAGGTKTYNENLTFPVNGTNGNEIILRGRQGDTIIVYKSGAHIIEFVNNSYWKFKNLQIGRDQTKNGWVYGTGINEGRLNVEHKRAINAAPGDASHHLEFINVIAYAGSFFDGSHIAEDCHHIKFDSCEFYYAGVNAGGELPDRGGNVLTLKCGQVILENCKGKWGGHENLAVWAPYCVMRGCISDGDWSDYKPTNPGRGNRASALDGNKGASPFGPSLVEKNIIRNADVDLEGGAEPGGKATAYRAIIRRNIYSSIVSGGTALIESPATNPVATDERRVYHNTLYDCDSIWESSDINCGVLGDDHFVDLVFKNNICAELGKGEDRNDAHIRFIRDNSSKRAGDPDDWRGSLFDNNVFSMASGNTFKVRLSGDGGASVTTLSSVESQWSSVFTNNSSTAPTFPSISNRTSDDYATIFSAFALGSGSEGENANIPLTNANGSGSSSALLIVDDARYFYDGDNSSTWDLGYFGEVNDYIKIVPNGLDPESNGTVVRIFSVDRDTQNISLEESATWSDGDDIYLVDSDGSTVINDLGANP